MSVASFGLIALALLIYAGSAIGFSWGGGYTGEGTLIDFLCLQNVGSRSAQKFLLFGYVLLIWSMVLTIWNLVRYKLRI